MGWFIVTFFACLLWLIIFSYCMVVWVTIIGAVFGISDYIMGLTILASGTSIPDALSSMYMAKEGRGDMAISSSIGSNVFDILVGLPVPTIIKYIVVAAQGNNLNKLARWNFDTTGIVFDTVLLLMMVALIITSIMLTNCPEHQAGDDDVPAVLHLPGRVHPQQGDGWPVSAPPPVPAASPPSADA